MAIGIVISLAVGWIGLGLHALHGCRRKDFTLGVPSAGFEAGVMEIEFAGGRVYRYTGPKVQAHYDGLMSAKSVGRYFANEVRFCPETACEQVTADA
jgi:hypothetical protein